MFGKITKNKLKKIPNLSVPHYTTNNTITTGTSGTSTGALLSSTTNSVLWSDLQDRRYCSKHGKSNNNSVNSITLGGYSFCSYCIADLLLESIDKIKEVPDHIPDKQIDKYIDTEVKRNNEK